MKQVDEKVFCDEPLHPKEVEMLARRVAEEGAKSATVVADAEGYLNITYHYGEIKFDRIRRITGYLVGTLDRFNDAKRAEERDRVKHGVGV